MFEEFKKFALRGNVIDLAVAVVIGAAFGAIVAALVRDLITPLLAAIGGQPDFSNLYFTLNNSRFMYGDFLNAVLSFLIMASAIFFLVVHPLNKAIRYSNRKKAAEETAKKQCPECLSDIPKAAKRCAFCTSKVT